MGHLLDFWLHSPLFFNLVDFPLHNLYGKITHDCYSFQKKISNIFISSQSRTFQTLSLPIWHFYPQMLQLFWNSSDFFAPLLLHQDGVFYIIFHNTYHICPIIVTMLLTCSPQLYHYLSHFLFARHTAIPPSMTTPARNAMYRAPCSVTSVPCRNLV